MYRALERLGLNKKLTKLIQRRMGLETNENKTIYMVWTDGKLNENGFLIIKRTKGRELKVKEVEKFTYIGDDIHEETKHDRRNANKIGGSK